MAKPACGPRGRKRKQQEQLKHTDTSQKTGVMAASAKPQGEKQHLSATKKQKQSKHTVASKDQGIPTASTQLQGNAPPLPATKKRKRRKHRVAGIEASTAASTNAEKTKGQTPAESQATAQDVQVSVFSDEDQISPPISQTLDEKVKRLRLEISDVRKRHRRVEEENCKLKAWIKGLLDERERSVFG